MNDRSKVYSSTNDLKPSKGVRIALILFVLFFLIITLAPMGIMALVGGGDVGIVIPSLIGLVVVGIISRFTCDSSLIMRKLDVLKTIMPEMQTPTSTQLELLKLWRPQALQKAKNGTGAITISQFLKSKGIEESVAIKTAGSLFVVLNYPPSPINKLSSNNAISSSCFRSTSHHWFVHG